MATIGERLRLVRERVNLPIRKFAAIIKENYTLLHHIEAGRRYPPKNRIKKYAKLLELSEKELKKLIALEKLGLNPDEVSPEIPPPFIQQEEMERITSGLLQKYQSLTGKSIKYPVEAGLIFREVYGLQTRFVDFDKKNLSGKEGKTFYGCLYSDGYSFEGRDKLILVNVGSLNGRKSTEPERLITLAHEGGHYSLHYSKNRKVHSDQLSLPFANSPTFCSTIFYRDCE